MLVHSIQVPVLGHNGSLFWATFYWSAYIHGPYNDPAFYPYICVLVCNAWMHCTYALVCSYVLVHLWWFMHENSALVKPIILRHLHLHASSLQCIPCIEGEKEGCRWEHNIMSGILLILLHHSSNLKSALSPLLWGMHVHEELVFFHRTYIHLGITKEAMLAKGNQPGSARWWAQRLDNYLRSKMPGYERMGTVSEHGVQFRVPLQGGTMIKCDLLMSPWWDDQEQYLEYIDGQVANGNLEETLKM